MVPQCGRGDGLHRGTFRRALRKDGAELYLLHHQVLRAFGGDPCAEEDGRRSEVGELHQRGQSKPLVGGTAKDQCKQMATGDRHLLGVRRDGQGAAPVHPLVRLGQAGETLGYAEVERYHRSPCGEPKLKFEGSAGLFRRSGEVQDFGFREGWRFSTSTSLARPGS